MSALNLLHLLPAAFIRSRRVIPVAVKGETLEVGVETPPTPDLLEELAFLTGRTVVPVRVAPDEVEAFLEAYPSGVAEDRPEAPPPRPVSPRQAHGAGSAVEWVERILSEAIARGASDIHVEPFEASLRVRYRLDGVLQVVETLAPAQRDAVTARLKVLAALDLAETRRPQDGRLRFRSTGRSVDLRVSTLPTAFGEKIVLRVLDRDRLGLDLEALGLSPADLLQLRQALRHPYGLVLVTGPTGSGKTTTLYAALRERNAPGVNITTIEDPVEYDLPGINQVQVRSDIGFTFARALRAFLRQDPDVIMVGEIRDTETAEIAVRAALTGHLVLSTLHTNDAPSAATRLVDMGVAPFLVAAAVRLVVAQRLVRRICPACKQGASPDPAVFAAHGVAPIRCYRGAGCAACRETGYRGRTALFEVMAVSDAVEAQITRRAGTAELRRCVQAEGVRSLQMAGWDRLRAGVTTVEEILRETMN